MDFFAKNLINWYKTNKRELPWRHTSDPYKIWLSEIILQQTQVVQGLSYYYKFVKHYPTVKHLAKAPIDEVMKHWQGLGYYSRARNLHKTAKIIVAEQAGVFPDDYQALQKLPGIGSYTAGAILAFAFSKAAPVVDGNIARVLSRLLNDPGDKKHFEKIAPKSVKVKVSHHHGGEPVVVSQTSAAFQAANNALQETYGKKPIPTRGGGSIPIVALFKKE